MQKQNSKLWLLPSDNWSYICTLKGVHQLSNESFLWHTRPSDRLRVVYRQGHDSPLSTAYLRPFVTKPVDRKRVLLQLKNNRTHSWHIFATLAGFGVEITVFGNPLPFSTRLDLIIICYKLLLSIPETKISQDNLKILSV